MSGGAGAEAPDRMGSPDPPRPGEAESLQDLGTRAGKALLRLGWTLAVAESCTGGWVTKVITDVPGSSRYLIGGAVTYADSAKVALLQVPNRLLGRHGAVSEEVARAMAEGVRRVLGADVGLAVTGTAGPGGGTPEKPVGTVWFALALPGSTASERACFPGDREQVRRRASVHALGIVLAGLPSGEIGR